jgi:hypothetical protein
MLQIAYGEANFANLRRRKDLFIDKTKFIPMMEKVQKFFFIRPRRFGKSLWISVLMEYYDINGKEKFDELFDGLFIKENPTVYKNSYLILKFDFSGMSTESLEVLRNDFNFRVKMYLLRFCHDYADIIGHELGSFFENQPKDFPASQMIHYLKEAVLKKNKTVYTFIDEYDHFANKLASEGKDAFVRDIFSKTGFVREFYEQMKIASGEGVFERFYITGVSPIVLDELSSGFNILSDMTTDMDYNEMLGFTEEEVAGILDKVEDDKFKVKNRSEVLKDLVIYYNGYRFNQYADNTIFNSDMVLYFIQSFSRHGRYPEEILDLNVKTDYGKLRGLIIGSSGKEKLSEVMEELNVNQIMEFTLNRRFTFEKRFNDDELKSMLFYLGLLTMKGRLSQFEIPNYVIRNLFWEYLRKYLEDRLEIEFNTRLLYKTIREMSEEGYVHGLKELATDFFYNKLSSYDFASLSEKHIKFFFVSYFTLSNIYNVISEREIGERKRMDLLFEAHPAYYNYVKYNYIVELKYIKKTDSEEVAKQKRDDAISQAKEYYEIYKRDFNQFGRELRSLAMIVTHTREVEVIQLGGF